MSFNTYLDRDLKEKFRHVTKQNDAQVDIVVEAIESYIKEHDSTLEAK